MSGRIKLPPPITQVAVDWVEYKKYLEKVHPKEWAKHYDNLWYWFCDTGRFHNGCFVHLEPKEVLGYTNEDKYGPAINWFVDRLFEDYPNVADKYGTIKLWVWW